MFSVKRYKPSSTDAKINSGAKLCYIHAAKHLIARFPNIDGATRLNFTMKKKSLVLLLLLLVTACGQIGPLYLPDNPPPIYQPKK